MIGWLNTREAVNIGLLFADISILFILGAMLWKEIRTPGWLNHLTNKAAAALFVYFFGMTIIRVWSAFLLGALKRGGDVFAIENTYPVSLAGSVIAFFGSVWIVQTFSPDDRRSVYWKGVLILTALIMLMTTTLGR